MESGADVTIINQAGHDAVFEAEINDKGEVVEWLLAAVEELEKGVGQDNEQGKEEGDAGDNDVEHVRTRIEGLEGPSQGG